MTVVKLNQNDELPTEPVQDVVDELQSLLDLAKKGVVRAVAYAIVQDNCDTFGTGWTGGAGTRNMLCAETNVLAHRVTGRLADSAKKV